MISRFSRGWTSGFRVPALLGLAFMAGCPACENEDLGDVRFELCMRPADVDFGERVIRTENTETIAVTNCGNVDVSSLSARMVAPSVEDEAALRILEVQVPVPLKQGEYFFLPVWFRPSDVRAYEAQLEITLQAENDQAATVTRRIIGEGVVAPACAARLSPDDVMMGEVTVGQSVERELTLIHTGARECRVGGARVTTGPMDYTVVIPPAETLAPGGSSTMRVRFSPSAPGTREGGVALVLDGDSAVIASLTGTGLSADRCALAVSPASAAFPRAAVNTTTSEVTLDILSVGEVGCTLQAPALVGPDFSVVESPAVGTVLMPGDADTITLRFTPGAVGARTGQVTILAQEGASIAVPLSAFGDPAPRCVLRYSPNPVTFEPLAAGLTQSQVVTAENISDLGCTVSSVTLGPTAGPDYALSGAPAPGTVVDPSDTFTFTVTFQPQAAALALGTAQVRFSDDGQDDVDLVGFADLADVRMTPALATFGIITTGCASRPVDVSLSNVGSVATRLDHLGFTISSDPNYELLTPVADNTMLAPAQTVALQVRMLGASAPGGHHGQLIATLTGARQPSVRFVAQGTTQSSAQAARTDVFIQRSRPAADILFVVDNSGSMSAEQANLAQNFGSFISFATNLDVDYNIGVTTTDVTTTGGNIAGGIAQPFICNACAVPTPDPVGTFLAQANVGTNGSADEKGLEASRLALRPPLTDPGGRNAGFVRDNALLVVVYVSDEEDHSAGAVSGYVQDLVALKNFDPNMVQLSAIAGDVPQGCNGTGGSATSGARYLQAAQSTGGVFASICAPDWSTTMQQLGLGVFLALTRFSLSTAPDPATIVVTVNGMVIPNDPVNGWSYDPETNTIVFNGTAVPEAGENIAIQYTSECVLP